MSRAPSADRAALPLAVQRQVDEVCRRFEAAWQAGPPPRIADYLGDAAQPGHVALLRELILTDVWYRRRDGEVPRPEDYLGQGLAPDAGWLARALESDGLRVQCMDDSGHMNKKIKEATHDKVPFLLIAGDREVAERTVTVRQRDRLEQETIPFTSFVLRARELERRRALVLESE